jgi:hypothetical protein
LETNAKHSILLARSNIVREIKSRMMNWAEHVVRMGEMGNAYKIMDEELERKIPL